MNSIHLVKGVGLGLAVSAPIGPIGILCIQRTIARGRLEGLFVGLGATLADLIFAAVAGFGVSWINDFLLERAVALRILGAVVLWSVAIYVFVTPPESRAADVRGNGKLASLATTFTLMISNPMAALGFAAAFAAFGAGDPGNRVATALVVSGVGLGSVLWWGLLSLCVGAFRDRFTPGVMVWINRGSGLLLAAFGVLAALSVFAPIPGWR